MTGLLRRLRGLPVLLDVGTEERELAFRATKEIH